jgi:type I restriction enzyme S subunit
MEIRMGYKKTDIGVIPEDWNVRKIVEFTNTTAGGTPSTLIDDYWNGNIRWMSSGELHLKKVFDVQGRITEKGLTNSATKLIPPYCVLIGLAGQGKTRGTVAINMVELCTNQSIAAILPCEEVMSEFLYYNLDSRYFEIRNQSTGTGGRGGLNLTIINNLEVALPPTKTEQTIITTALSDVDALISSLEKLIAKKRNIKQGAMQELLKPKDGWENKKLGDIADINKGEQLNRATLTEGDTYPVMNGGILPSGYTSNWNQKAGTIIISEGGNSCGFVNFIKTNFWQGGHCYSLETTIHKEFLFHILKFCEREIMALRVGSGLPNIQRNRLANYELGIPSPIEQQKIAIILNDMDAEISAIETKLEKYKMIKQGMMQTLLTGKIRLI